MEELVESNAVPSRNNVFRLDDLRGTIPRGWSSIDWAASMALTVGVGCIVLREHDETPVLLLRRAFGEFENEWGFVGGTVESEELPDATAERELFEETGIRAVPVFLSTVEPSDLEAVIHVFLARVRGTPVVVLDSENSDSRWVSFGDANRMLPLSAQKNALQLARRTQSIDAG